MHRSPIRRSALSGRKKTRRWSIGQQDGQARKDEQKKSDELENDDSHIKSSLEILSFS